MERQSIPVQRRTSLNEITKTSASLSVPVGTALVAASMWTLGSDVDSRFGSLRVPVTTWVPRMRAAAAIP